MANSMIQMPGYYAVIPANVRYDSNLPGNAKLLYGEITALSNAYGYCFASNEYFAALYGVDERTIRRWLAALEERNYIFREVQVDEKTGLKKRIIRLCDSVLLAAVQGGGQKCPQGGTKMSEGADSNVRYNNTLNNTPNIYSARAKKTDFRNFDQREYNYDELERALFNIRDGDTG